MTASASIKNPQTFNRYGYVLNSPYKFVDPNGLQLISYNCFCTNADVPEIGYIDPHPICNTCWIWIDDRTYAGLQAVVGDAILGNLFDNFDPTSPNKCGVNPVTGTPGINRMPYNQQGNLRSDSKGSGEHRARRGGNPNGHKGIDIFGQLNQPVVSFLSGTVTRIAPNNGDYGNTIEVTSAGGIVSKYHHLATINVGLGDTVGPGQGIGTLGQTGNAGGTNPHLDFEIFKNGIMQNPVNVLNSPCP